MILDIGSAPAKALADIIAKAGTVVWNGPVGVFRNGTPSRAAPRHWRRPSTSKAFHAAGGGDTVSAINVFKIGQGRLHLSTAGGAFLEFLEGKAPACR